MQELSAILRSDPRKVFGEDGQMIPVHLWSDEVAAAVSSVEVIEMAGDDDQKPATVKKVKFWDKNSAIDKAMKHMGLFEKDNRQKNGALGDLPRELLQEIVERIRQVNEQQRRAITVD